MLTVTFGQKHKFINFELKPFLTGTFGPGMFRGDPFGVPLNIYEHPIGVFIPTPSGLVSGSFFFSYRTVSLRLPGSYTTPRRGVVTLRLMRTHACAYNFGHFDCKLSHFVRVHFGQNCASFLFFDRLPSGPVNPSG